eukprot:185222_1
MLLLSYPITLGVMSGFSIFPLLTYLTTEPNEIGKNYIFHRKLYRYCCNSKDEEEFNLKLVVINYVCIHSYFHRLRETETDASYYQFASILYQTPIQKLQYVYTMNPPEFKLQLNSWVGDMISIGIKAKIGQIIMRATLLTACLIMDIYFTVAFHGYRNMNMLITFGTTGAVLFVIWLCWTIYLLFISRWIKFCHYMIASKNHTFILNETIEEFIQKCNDIVQKNYNATPHAIHLKTQPQIWYDTVMKNTNIIIEFSYSKSLMSVLIAVQFFIIGVLTLIAHLHVEKNSCFHSKRFLLLYNDVTICIALIICFTSIINGVWRGFNKTFLPFGIFQAISFSCFASQAAINSYMMYFYYDNHCARHHEEMLLLTQCIGCLLCYKEWNFILSISLFISYVIFPLQMYQWYYIVISTFSISICFVCAIKSIEMLILKEMVLQTHVCVFIFMVSLFTAKDILVLVVQLVNECNEYSSQIGNIWIFIGCSVHCVAAVIIIYILHMKWYRLTPGAYKSLLKSKNILIMVVIAYYIFAAWAILGLVLHLTMESSRQHCVHIIVSWSILQMVESCLTPCIYYALYWSYSIWYDQFQHVVIIH